ncbi:MAG: SCP2 sterol-binding domain-containing protein [Solirubrobacterales bacterium]
MAYFSNADDLYKYVGGVFRAGAEHETVGPKLAAAGVTLQLHYTDPDSQLTVRFTEPMEVIEGDTDESPDIHLYMRADDADKFWRGEYNLAVGLAKGQVRAKGPVNKILRLVPLTKPLFPIYRDLTAEKDAAGQSA